MSDVDRVRIHKIIDDLNIPHGRFALAGSGVMVLHGIDRRPRDLDLYVATQTWFSMYSARTPLGQFKQWDVFTTDPDDPKRRCDPPYLFREMQGLEVNVFFDWRTRGVGDIDVNFWVHNAELVEGVPCIPIQFLLDWKTQVGRNKDVNDIRLIREHLGLGVDGDDE